MTEGELLSLAQRGDATAWGSVMQTHQQAAFRLAYLLLGDPADAEDVAQEAFIHAYRALNRFDPARPFRPWLLRITTNLARNRQRSLGRYFSALQRFARADPLVFVSARPEAPTSPEAATTLWQAIRKLNENEQEILCLRYFLEMPEAEMAAALEVAPGTVKSRLHRALTRLRAVVEREFPNLREMVEV